MPQTLLDIAAEMQALDDLLAATGGDITDPEVDRIVTAWFNETGAALVEKADHYAALIAVMRHRVGARTAESVRLKGLAEQDRRSADFLEGRLLAVLLARGITKLHTRRYRLTTCRNGGPVPLEIDQAVLPPAFWQEVPATREPDSERIRAALATGEAIPGVRVLERRHHLRMA